MKRIVTPSSLSSQRKQTNFIAKNKNMALSSRGSNSSLSRRDKKVELNYSPDRDIYTAQT